MKKLLSLLALVLISLCAFSQATGSSASAAPPLDSEGERSRIQAERAREEAQFEKDQAACYARFAVTDCIGQARVRRRAALDQLRGQEIVLNDAERKRKALEQMQRLEEKSSGQQDAEEVARRIEARAAQQEREERAIQKGAAASRPKPTPSAGKRAQKLAQPGRTANDVASEKKQYNDKLREASEHRDSRKKSNDANPANTSKPLPDSP